MSGLRNISIGVAKCLSVHTRSAVHAASTVRNLQLPTPSSYITYYLLVEVEPNSNHEGTVWWRGLVARRTLGPARQAKTLVLRLRAVTVVCIRVHPVPVAKKREELVNPRTKHAQVEGHHLAPPPVPPLDIFTRAFSVVPCLVQPTVSRIFHFYCRFLIRDNDFTSVCISISCSCHGRSSCSSFSGGEVSWGCARERARVKNGGRSGRSNELL